MVLNGQLNPLFVHDEDGTRHLLALGFVLPEDAVLPKGFEKGGPAVLKYTRNGSFTVVPAQS